MNKILTPIIATHPGELLRDELRERGLSQKQLSKMTGIKASVISDTIAGKRAVSLNVAVALEKALGISAEMWLNLQTQYNLDSAGISKRESKQETVQVTIPTEDRNLLKELVRKFGWACVL
jgi:addiction module HigA family antidote